MMPNVRSCYEWKLYVIADRAAAGDRPLTELVAAAIRGGADAIQLRDKRASIPALLEEAQALLPLTRAAGIPLIINDRADATRAVEAEGVHVGQNDLPLRYARTIIGPRALVGKSTHSLAQALAAEAEGVDYIGLGPLYPTPTKPDTESVGLALISAVAARVRIPIVCIGGIDAANVRAVVEAGARCVAVLRAVCAAADPEASTRTLKQTVEQALHATSPSTL